MIRAEKLKAVTIARKIWSDTRGLVVMTRGAGVALAGAVADMSESSNVLLYKGSHFGEQKVNAG